MLAILAMVAAGCGESQTARPGAEAQSRKVVEQLDAPLDRLKDAAASARPSRRSTMVTLQASADRAGDAVRQADRELTELEEQSDAGSRSALRRDRDALDDIESLTDTLASPRLSIDDLQVSAERARQATEDARFELPVVNTARLASAVRRSRRRKSPPATQSARAPAPSVAAPSGAASSGFNTGTSSGQNVPAAVCRFQDGVYCWTPNDGYTLKLAAVGPQRLRGDEASNRGLNPSSYLTLAVGESRSSGGYRCVNSAEALTCTNPSGAGWQLPRYRGLPRLF